MATKNLIRNLLIIAGAIIGFIAGALLGLAIGRGLDLMAAEHFFAWRTLYGMITGAVAGLIAGAGTGGFGIRTRLGFEWALIFGIGTLVGSWFQTGAILDDMGLIVGIGAAACWLVTHLVRLFFGRWLTRGVLEKKIVVAYFLIGGLVAVVVPYVLKLIATIFYF